MTETYHNCYGEFFAIEQARNFDYTLHTTDQDIKRAWDSYDYVEQPGMFGPVGTHLLESDGGKDGGWFPLGPYRYVRLYLFINPSLGIAQATLGLIGEQGIEAEQALNREMTEWLVSDLLHPREASW